MNINWIEIANSINDQTGRHFVFKNPQSIGGGCINQAWRVTDQKQKNWFVKINKPSRLSMFEAELLGLQEILASQAIQAPTPLCAGQTLQHSFLIMEYLEFGCKPDFTVVGKQLAKMHQTNQVSFGWLRDNTIGSTPQVNTYDKDWIRFWREQRLEFQLNLALKKGFPHCDYTAGIKLSESLDLFFTSYQPTASLLHGDLWGGNCSADGMGNPIIYDPAVYYGDREADLAMTELFGGFGHRFMESYHNHFSIDSGYPTRKTLYNLYHILNHFNLFGGGYGSQASSMIHSLLSELR